MIRLYHGTPNVGQVLEEGLIPNKERRHESSLQGYVYLARRPATASSFGHVVEVELPDEADLEWDPEIPEEAVIYEGSISPERIEIYNGPIDAAGATAVDEEAEIPESEMSDLMKAQFIDEPTPVEEVIGDD